MMSGVESDTKDSHLIPRFDVYHFVDAGMDFTVRTRWSRDLMIAGLRKAFWGWDEEASLRS